MSSLIMQAAKFAAEAHAGQKRKYNGTPYIWHPMRVAGRLMCLTPLYYIPEEVVAAAWLHDVKEDCLPYWEEHCNELPQEVIELVEHLTHTSKTGMHAHLNRAARKELDRQQLAKAPFWAKVIKCLDRLDNLNEMSYYDDEGFYILYCRESLQLFEALAENEANEVVLSLAVAGKVVVKSKLDACGVPYERKQDE